MNSISIRKYITRGATAATADGRKIVFNADNRQVCASVQLNVQLDIEPDRAEQRSDLIRAVSRFTDDAGRVWETCDRISVADLYYEAIRRPLSAFAADLKAPGGDSAASQNVRVELRTLIREAVVFCDDRDFRPVCVTRAATNPNGNGTRSEILFFLVQDKYFSAKLDLIERVFTRSGPNSYEGRTTHVLISPESSPATSTAIAPNGDPIKIDRVDYCQLAPLSAEVRLGEFLWSTAWRRERDDDIEYWQRETRTAVACTPTSERGEPAPGVTVQ